MFFFCKADVYIGYSLEELSKVRAILKQAGIKYTYKVTDHSGWGRGRGGTFGLNPAYQKLYTVSVRKRDFEKAKYLVNQALHS